MDPPQPSSATASSPTSSPGCGGAKLRLLCSYGGRIVPRPHDKALCYAGGETRLLAVDRRTATSSLSALTSHISRTLLNGRPFCLKYQLPDHDLDSLVSVSTDEDLANMIDEYDRASLSANPTRLRFFIFPAAKADSSIADYDPRSEAWFFDALRNAGIAVDGKRSSESGSGGEGMMESGEGKYGVTVDSSPTPAPGSGAVSSESVFLDTIRAAQPPIVNLPAIKVAAGEELAGAQGQDLKHPYSHLDSPESDSCATSPNFQSPTLVYLDSLSQSDNKDSKLFANQMEADISASDIAPRTDQHNSMQTYGYSLSAAKDQMQQQSSLLQTQAQVQAHLQPQPQPQPTLQSYQQLQPQYVHAAPQYVSQYYSGAVPATSYSTAYQPYMQQQQHQQQQQQQQKQQANYQLNNPYPCYLMHVNQTQAQRDLSPASSLPSSHPHLLPNPSMMVTSPVGYDGLGSAKCVGPAKSADITAKVYRAGATVSQPISVQSVGVPSEELQPQILAVAQMSTAQPVPVSPVVDGSNYGGAAELDDSMHTPIYKTQQPASPVVPQRQVATNATAILMDNLSQLQLESSK